MIWTAIVIEELQGCTARMRDLIGSVGPVTSVSSLGLSVSVPRGWDLKLEKNWVRAGQWMDCLPEIGGFGLNDFPFGAGLRVWEYGMLDSSRDVLLWW